MNITNKIVNRPDTFTLAAGKRKVINQVGNFFILISNSLSTRVQIAIGDDVLGDWDVLYSFTPRDPAAYFSRVTFYNPSGSDMTLKYIISNGIINNNSAEITGTIAIPIVDVTDAIETPPATRALDLAGWLINNAAAVNVGGGVVGIPVTGHHFLTGESVTITGTTNYDGVYVVLASSGANQVDITATYVAETFDGVNDTIAPSAPRSIAANSDRRELIVHNHDPVNVIYWGDSNIDPANYRGIPIPPNSAYIITNTAQIYFASETGAGVNGCIVSYAELTKT